MLLITGGDSINLSQVDKQWFYRVNNGNSIVIEKNNIEEQCVLKEWKIGPSVCRFVLSGDAYEQNKTAASTALTEKINKK